MFHACRLCVTVHILYTQYNAEITREIVLYAVDMKGFCVFDE